MELIFFPLIYAIQTCHTLTVKVSGPSCVIQGVPYTISCTVDEYRDNRQTIFSAKLSETNREETIVWYYKPHGCFQWKDGTATDCRNASCACDNNGLTTHWTNNTPFNLSKPVIFECSSTDQHSILQSDSFTTAVSVDTCESLTVTITGKTYIEPGVPYNVTCIVDEYRDNRQTTFSATLLETNREELIVWYYKPYGCFQWKESTATDCRNASCACNINGLTTHWVYNPPSDLFSSVIFQCQSTDNDSIIITSDLLIPQIAHQVKKVTFVPAGNNNVIAVLDGMTQSFTCTTDSSRPASWIQWYIGGNNVTNQAKPQFLKQEGDELISSSGLVYTGKDVDHGKIIFCEAMNIEGRDKVKSIQKYIYIQITLTAVTIMPAGNNTIIKIVEGESNNFTCTTSFSRPAAMIQWYVGLNNLTNKAQSRTSIQYEDGGKSSSRLMYTGNDFDHNKRIYCEAFTVNDSDKVRSISQTVYIQIPVRTLTVLSVGNSNVIDVVEGEPHTFTCTTDSIRPAADIQWFIGENNVTNQAQPHTQQLDEDKFLSSSSLLYTVRNADHNKVVSCEADNINSRYRVNSTEKYMYVQFGPKAVTLSPTTNTYIVTETRRTHKINCSAVCRPDCNYTWTGPNGFKENKAYLQFHSIYRNHSGLYMCNAMNDIGSKSSINVNIKVNYAPTILQLQAIHGNTVDELKSVVLQCNVDSYPAPDITWIFTRTNNLLKSVKNVKSSNYTIDTSNCLQTGIYRCQASNMIDTTAVTAYKETEIFVLCSVRIDKRHPETLGHIAVLDNEELNITVFLLAYPKPLISWTVKGFEAEIISTVEHQSSFKIFEHTTTVHINNIARQNFGVYTVHAFNNIGLQYTQSFTVLPQGRPDQPTDVLVACEITSMIVSWRPGFNGGNKQTFTIAWLNTKTQFIKYSSDIIESNYGQNQQYVVEALVPDTLYVIFIEASNTHGIARSTNNATCTTKSSSNYGQSNSFLAISVSVGIGSAVVILIVAGLVCFALKRKTHNRKENNILYQSTQPGDIRDNSFSDQHIYNELQTIKPNSKNENRKTIRSVSSYEEVGRLNDEHHYHEIKKDKEDSREQYVIPTA